MINSKTEPLVKKPPLIELLMAMSLAAIMAVLYTPALPRLTTDFDVSKSSMQFTVTIFLLGYSLGPLIYGPLANRFGRRSVLLTALGLAVVSNVVCLTSIYSHDFTLLLIGRFFLALGASAGLSVVMTMIGDRYEKVQTRKLMAWANLAFALAPGLGVMIGGILEHQYKTHSVFYFSLFYSIVVWVITMRLEETLPHTKRSNLQFSTIRTGYVLQLKKPLTLICGTLMGCSTAITYIYSAEAPFVGITVMKLSAQDYGLWNLVPYLGMAIGSIVSMRIAHTTSLQKALSIGTVLVTCGAIAMLVSFAMNWLTIISLFIVQAICSSGLALISSNSSAVAMTNSDNKAVTSSVLNTLNIGLAFFMVLILNSVAGIKSLSMPILYLVLVCVIISCIYLLRGRDK